MVAAGSDSKRMEQRREKSIGKIMILFVYVHLFVPCACMFDFSESKEFSLARKTQDVSL